jgi:hypothetical protein
MYTLICNLKFQDGAQVEASISADSPLSLCSIEWRGAVDRIPANRLRLGRVSTLRAQVKGLATRLDAQLMITSTGTFDREVR